MVEFVTKISEFWNSAPYQSGQGTKIDQVGLEQYQNCNITQLYISVDGSSSIHLIAFNSIAMIEVVSEYFDTAKQFLKMKIQLKTVRYPGQTWKENVKIFFPLEEVIYIFLRIWYKSVLLKSWHFQFKLFWPKSTILGLKRRF